MNVNPTAPIPDVTAFVQAILQFLGVSPIVIAFVGAAFAIESWISSGKRAVKAASVVSSAAIRSGTWLFRQPATRIIIAAASTLVVLAVQVFMIRLSYISGSIIATPFDPVRWATLDAAYDASPLRFVDPTFYSQFLKLDWISAVYVGLSILLIICAYGPNGRGTGLWIVLATPWNIALFGALSIGIFSIAFDIFFSLLYLLVGHPLEWAFIKQYVFSAPGLSIALVSVIYCGTAYVACKGATVVRQLWTIGSTT